MTSLQLQKILIRGLFLTRTKPFSRSPLMNRPSFNLCLKSIKEGDKIIYPYGLSSSSVIQPSGFQKMFFYPKICRPDSIKTFSTAFKNICNDNNFALHFLYIKGVAYHICDGQIFNKDMEPLVFLTRIFSTDKLCYKHILYVSPEVYINETYTELKKVVDKILIPTYLNERLFTSEWTAYFSDNTACSDETTYLTYEFSIRIEDPSIFIHKVKKPNPNMQQEINKLLADNADNIPDRL